jgi:hypothetical protein
MNVLYDVANHWQGEWLQKTYCQHNMWSSYFSTPSSINTYLLPKNPISDPNLLGAIYTDPWYGLNNYENYA